jgi:hypothetical protein
MPAGIRVRGVENPQGFGIDERKFNAALSDNQFQKNNHFNFIISQF